MYTPIGIHSNTKSLSELFPRYTIVFDRVRRPLSSEENPTLKRIIALSGFLLVCTVLSLGCDPKKPIDPTDPKKECQNHAACWKKACPQTEPNEYEACVEEKLKTQNKAPEYTLCNAKNKCETVAEADLGSGEVEVSFPEDTKEKIAKDQVKWLRMYILPSHDLKGTKLDCAALKALQDKDPKALISKDLGRFYPPPDWTKAVTTEVVRSGDTLPLLFSEHTVPKGSSHILVVQGFCNPDEGRPDMTTQPKWWACAEGTTITASKTNKLKIILPVKNGDRCK